MPGVDTKILDLGIATTLHDDDWFVVVNTHDASMDPTGTTSRMAPAVVAAEIGPLLTIAESQVTGLASDLAGKEPVITAGTTAQYLRGDKSLATLNQAAVAGLTTASSPTFAGLTVGSATGILKAASGVVSASTHVLVGSSGQLNLDPIAAPGSPSDGDIWYDSTQLSFSHQRKGVTASPVGLLFSQVTNVTVTTNSLSTLLSTTNAYNPSGLTLPAGFLNVQGKTLRIKGGGHYSTGAAAGQVSFALKLGSGIVATNTAAVTQNANVSNQKFFLDIVVTTKATGASGKLDISGKIAQWFASGTTFGIYLANGTTVSAGAPQTQVTLDLTASYAIDFQILMNVTVNSYTLANFTVEALN